MRLRATLSPAELRRSLEQFLPLQLELGATDGGRRIEIDEVQTLSFVPEQGVRVVCAGTVTWPVLGIDVPVRISSLQLLIRLSRELRPSANLLIRLSLEDADIAWVPDALDRTVRERVNAELREHQVELAWDFERLLSHTFALPESLASTASISLHVDATSLRVESDAIELELKLLTSTRSRPAKDAR